VSGQEVPDPLGDTLSLLGSEALTRSLSAPPADELALRLKERIARYKRKLGDSTVVVVIGLHSATKGRMAMTFYREITGLEFLRRIQRWHLTCAWFHRYHPNEVEEGERNREKPRRDSYLGAPSPNDIAEAAYGLRLNDELRRTTVERILSCIIDGRRLPVDLVDSAIRHASDRAGVEHRQWENTLSVACALYRKSRHKEDYPMSLDSNRRTRDYLYGRLLALAESLEQRAVTRGGESRQTNASRLMQRFSEHPYSTWRTLDLALSPYKGTQDKQLQEHVRLISEVMTLFDPQDFSSDKKLSGEFLLAYYCQREALWKDPDHPPK
jgi:CRISPR-associated protein Csd1